MGDRMSSSDLELETVSECAKSDHDEIEVVDEIGNVEEPSLDENEIAEEENQSVTADQEKLKNLENDKKVKNKGKANKTRCSSTTLLFSIVCIISATIVMIVFSIERRPQTSKEFKSKDELKESVSGCPFWHLTNDKVCDDEANIEECQFDQGDCCEYQSDFSTCQDCFCHTKASTVNESIQNCALDTNKWLYWFQFLGNGICQLDLNNAQNFFDAGDCCLNSTQCDWPIEGTMLTGSIRWDSMKIDCPENVCVKSNIYCNQEQMGDGICHDNNNSILCDYDLGDCCIPDTVEDSCCLCLCSTIHFGK